MMSGRMRRPACASALACLCATGRPAPGAPSPPKEWADEAARTAGLIRRAVADGAASGKRKRVSVTFAGRSETVTVVGASPAGLVVRTQRSEARIPWTKIDAGRLYHIGKRYVSGDAATHGRLLRYCLVNGLVDEADGELGELLRASPESRAKVAGELEYLQGLKSPKAISKTDDDASGEETSKDDVDEPENGEKDPVSAWYRGRVHAKGKVSRSAYVRHAYSWDLQTMHRRLGPDYEFFQKLDAKARRGRQTGRNRRDTKPNEFPTVPMATTKESKLGRNGQGFTYQIGGPPRRTPATSARRRARCSMCRTRRTTQAWTGWTSSAWGTCATNTRPRRPGGAAAIPSRGPVSGAGRIWSAARYRCPSR